MIRHTAGLGCLLLLMCASSALGQSAPGSSTGDFVLRRSATPETSAKTHTVSDGSTVALDHLQQIAEKKSWWSTPSWMKWGGGKSTPKKKSSSGFSETSKRWWGNIKKALDPFPDDLEPKTIDKPTIGDWQDLERPKF